MYFSVILKAIAQKEDREKEWQKFGQIPQDLMQQVKGLLTQQDWNKKSWFFWSANTGNMWTNEK